MACYHSPNELTNCTTAVKIGFFQGFTICSIWWRNSSVEGVIMFIVNSHGKMHWMLVSSSMSSKKLAGIWSMMWRDIILYLNNFKDIIVSEETMLFHWHKKSGIKGITYACVTFLIATNASRQLHCVCTVECSVGWVFVVLLFGGKPYCHGS